MSAVIRWLPGVLLGLSVVLAVGAALDHRPLAAVLWMAAAAFWAWRARSAATPPAQPPAHADEEWARGVLARAGSPQGVRAVQVLRDAEPALSLLQAKQLADRVAG